MACRHSQLASHMLYNPACPAACKACCLGSAKQEHENRLCLGRWALTLNSMHALPPRPLFTPKSPAFCCQPKRSRQCREAFIGYHALPRQSGTDVRCSARAMYVHIKRMQAKHKACVVGQKIPHTILSAINSKLRWASSPAPVTMAQPVLQV